METADIKERPNHSALQDYKTFRCGRTRVDSKTSGL